MLAFLLSVATNSPALYEKHYVWLFWVNVATAALLGFALAWALAVPMASVILGQTLVGNARLKAAAIADAEVERKSRRLMGRTHC